jgi:nitrogen fixation NifU-like protein
MVIGMTLDEAMKVKRDDVAGELDGLPPIKLHCSNLAADALHEAIENYRRRESGEVDEPPECDDAAQTERVVFKTEFENNGLYRTLGDQTVFNDQRTLVIYTGEASIKAAIKLTDHTDRVILLSCNKDIKMPDELNKLLGNSGVKILYQSQLLEIRGDFEVERALIRNLDEDEEYELFIDAVVILG